MSLLLTRRSKLGLGQWLGMSLSAGVELTWLLDIRHLIGLKGTSIHGEKVLIEFSYLVSPASFERLVLERAEVFSNFVRFNSTNRVPCINVIIISVFFSSRHDRVDPGFGTVADLAVVFVSSRSWACSQASV